jgi:uncharacterized protein
VSVMTCRVVMQADECAALLEKAEVGRLGVIVDGRPEIFPVSHVYDRDTGCIAFPTNDGTKMRSALAWPYVAYEVDGFERGGNGGWSVAMVGTAEEVTDPQQIARWTSARHVLWFPGDTSRWIRIVPSKVTGWHIYAVDR